MAEGGRFWLVTDYTYTDFEHKQPGSFKETARLAGVRGEVGLRLMGGLGISYGGEYQDGNTTFEGTSFGGTPMRVVTNDYIRQTQALVHFVYGPAVFAAGMAERYWYNDLVVSYRRRTQYNYIPIYVTYRAAQVYVKVEHDIWQRGTNKTHMSDVNPAARDVEFKLGDGSGMGVEIGYVIPGMVTTRIFAAYHKWDIKESDVQSDGTQDLVEPKNSTTEIKAGIGLAF